MDGTRHCQLLGAVVCPITFIHCYCNGLYCVPFQGPDMSVHHCQLLEFPPHPPELPSGLGRAFSCSPHPGEPRRLSYFIWYSDALTNAPGPPPFPSPPNRLL
ncbi:hypothetical protein DPEC_G00327190 [Dallia pectoralis]|uniref:Uncharacterized protein n=1 Tax=Dallia pectoralis TaxID=75939 RepID=A0ACC2F814_DALPE|nr:hypothetical protein DPEC_G00327190 [Dallia pectoralis]